MLDAVGVIGEGAGFGKPSSTRSRSAASALLFWESLSMYTFNLTLAFAATVQLVKYRSHWRFGLLDRHGWVD